MEYEAMVAQAVRAEDGRGPWRSERDAGRVGPFELVARLGVGGMATVYLGAPRGPSQGRVAVKVMHPHLALDPDFVRMFLQEARLAERVRHRHVVRAIDAGRDGELLYAAMDYVEGDTLASVQATAAALGRGLPVGIVLRVVLDALAGLDAVHELRDEAGDALHVVHRDVTPHNLLVGTDGAARLTDFGVARMRGGLVQTLHGVLKGKLPYMAPEQLEGRAVDRRADLFAMGVTLWEALTLRRLFPARATDEQARRDARAPYRSLRDFNPALPLALDAICYHALAYDPAARFATAADFARAIERELPDLAATPRELGGFVAAVAHPKVERERDALRAARAPAPWPRAPLRREPPAQERRISGAHEGPSAA